jgi:hypothetical protein
MKTPNAKKALTTVPCGRCVDCKKRRISGWSFRLVQECRVSSSALFITFTYDDDHVPLSEKGYQTLDKTDIQKFFKRLRKLHDKRYGKQEKNTSSTNRGARGTLNVSNRIKYYVCGEYGTRTARPHYHAICFNANVRDIEKAWAIGRLSIGNIHVGEVNEQTIGYTLKYIAKDRKVPLWEGDDRQPEFSLMSKGLGKSYLTEQRIKWHKNDLLNRMYCVTPGDIKLAMPRYYKEKIYTKHQLERISRYVVEQRDKEEAPDGAVEKSQIIGRIRKANKGNSLNSKL